MMTITFLKDYTLSPDGKKVVHYVKGQTAMATSAQHMKIFQHVVQRGVAVEGDSLPTKEIKVVRPKAVKKSTTKG